MVSVWIAISLVFVAFCAGFTLAAILATGVRADEMVDADRQIRSLQAALEYHLVEEE